MGGTVVDNEFAYQQKDVDFKSLLIKIRRSKPDVIFVPGYYSEVALILKQARQMRITVPILGGDGWDSPTLQKLAGSGVKNTYISSHFSSEDSDEKVKNFVKSYKETYNETPGAMAALGYDALFVLANALERSKDFTPVEIKAAINSTKDFQGVTGKISLDQNRDAIKSAVVLEVTEQGNKFNQKVTP